MSRWIVFVLGVFFACAAGEPLPKTMRAAQASGIPCSAPYWSCLAVNSAAAVPSPGKGQLLLEMFGAGLNPLDVDLVEPLCKSFPPGTPFKCSNGTIGAEGAGIVAAVGESCIGFSVGDEVWGFAQGAFAEYALVSCELASAKPRILNLVDAGTIPVVGLTSLQCLYRMGAPWKRNGNITVAVTGGQGGTGFIAIQLAKVLGAAKVVTAATGAGIAMVKSLGADIAIDFHEEDLFDALPDNSVDFVFDNIGFEGTADKAMHAIRPGGTFLLLTGGGHGELSKHPKAGVQQIHFGSMAPSVKDLQTLAGLFDSFLLHPYTFKAYTLSEVPEAFSRSLASGLLGKIAVVPDAMSVPQPSILIA